MSLKKIALLYLLSWMPANATIVRIDSLSRMVEDSEVIAHVLVGEKSIKTDCEGRPTELTTVEVIKGIKGLKTGQLATIYQLGAGDFQGAQRIVGQSEFEMGEEFILFGMKHNDMIVSYGVGLGKFKILRAGKKAKVIEDFKELLAYSRDSQGVRLGPPIPREFPTLNQFQEAIYESMNAPWKVIKTGPKARREGP